MFFSQNIHRYLLKSIDELLPDSFSELNLLEWFPAFFFTFLPGSFKTEAVLLEVQKECLLLVGNLQSLILSAVIGL